MLRMVSLQMMKCSVMVSFSPSLNSVINLNLKKKKRKIVPTAGSKAGSNAYTSSWFVGFHVLGEKL